MKTSIRAITTIALMLISVNLSAQDLEWVHSVGADGWDEGLGICLDDNQNIYTIGLFYSTTDFDPSASVTNLISNGQSDAYIASYDKDGNFRWAFNFGGTDYDVGWSVKNYNNYLYVTGYFQGTADFDPSTNTANLTSNGSADIFVACYDTDGNYQWAYNYGSTGWDSGNNISVDHNGHPIAIGSFEGTVDFNPSAGTANLTGIGNGDMWIAKYGSDGSYRWAINPAGSSMDRGNSVVTDYYGNVYAVGQFQGTVDFDPSGGTANLTSSGSNDISICSYDPSGNYRWAGNLGGVGSDVGWSICSKTYSGGQAIFFTGDFEQTGDFDPSAGTANLTSSGGKDIFVTALNTNGDFLWTFNVGGQNYDSAYYITNDNVSNIFITGDTGGGDFDPSANDAIFPGLGNSDIFIASYNWQGNYRGAQVFGGPNMEFGNSLAVANPIYLLGEFVGTGDFDPSVNTYNLTSNGSQTDILLGKYDSDNLEIDNVFNRPNQIALGDNYPNPFNPSTTIEYNVPHDSNVIIEIIDLNGKLIRTIVNNFKRAGTYSINWDARDSENKLVSSGSYFYNLKSNGIELTKKMILLR